MAEQPSPFADREPTEEELRAYEQQLRAYEEQLAWIRVEDVLVQTIVSLLNLGARRGGLVPAEGGEGSAPAGEVDLDQLRLAIEGARALMPVVESSVDNEGAAELKQLREALSQLQMAYAAKAGVGAPAPNESPAQSPQGPGPAQSSGRLWVPGQ
jgi:hypothetical protein